MSEEKSGLQIGVGIAVGVLIYIGAGLITDPIHDYFFLSHTSIQDGVSSCTGGRYGDCITEDGVRAYDSTFWAILGNSFALVMTLIRFAIGYVGYRIVVNWIRWK